MLVFVVYNRRREAHIKYPGPDDDVRENIINYDDEGGGEDDMTAFDITPLQIPIGGPMPPELATMKMPIMCKYNECCYSNITPTTIHTPAMLLWTINPDCPFKHIYTYSVMFGRVKGLRGWRQPRTMTISAGNL